MARRADPERSEIFAPARGVSGCGREFGFGCALRHSCEHPQIVSQHAPADRELAMGKALGAERLAEEVM